MEKDDFPVFQNPDSDGGTFFWEGTKDQDTAILVLHGFTATTVEVRPIATFLNDRGFTVLGPLLPGHGISPEELNKVKFQDWLACVEMNLETLTSRYKNVFLLGESMGALLSLWLATNHPALRGVMIFAPALRIHGLWRSRLIWPFVKYMKKKRIDLTSPWQGFNVVPLQAAAQLNRLQAKVRSILHKIHQPILIFQGKLDHTIDPLGSVVVLENVRSTDKELVWLNDSPHVILLDKQFDLVCDLCLEFIQRTKG